MKRVADFIVVDNLRVSNTNFLLKLHLSGRNSNSCYQTNQDHVLDGILPGQFVQVRIDNGRRTFLRRPISVCFVDAEKQELWLLVREAGPGSEWLCTRSSGCILNLILPLGNGFDIEKAGNRPLLVGGGVGMAPLLYLGKKLHDKMILPTFLLAAKSASDLVLLEEFRKYGCVELSTDDGSMGASGLVTSNPAFAESWSMIYCCGPKPMMVGVSRLAAAGNISCEVSLENTMACGVGACLCCVEDTLSSGNLCVCTEGPVFDYRDLKWPIE